VNSSNAQHEVQAVNVTGINRGPLMCETRRTNIPQDSERSERPSSFKKRPVRAPRVSNSDESAADAVEPVSTTTESEPEFKQVVSKRRAPKK
jgi:hypothetical protein